MEYANIIYSVNEGIATIKLNRPKALNALNSEINADIMAAINEVKADPSVRVLIVTGSERAFAAGADVKEMAEATPRYAREFCGLAIEINNELESLPIPTIAAVGGFAFGGEGAQRRLLEGEGVTFLPDGRVDMETSALKIRDILT